MNKTDLESRIQEILVRETTKYGREGQVWTNQALSKGLANKLATEFMDLIDADEKLFIEELLRFIDKLLKYKKTRMIIQ